MTDYPNYEYNDYEDYREPVSGEYEEYWYHDADNYNEISKTILDVNVFFEFFTIFANIFHLVVLFQKELRSSSIFILMIGICLADIFGFLCQFYDHGIERSWFRPILQIIWSIFPQNSDVLCLSFDYQLVDIPNELKNIIISSTRPISIWLAILMAMIRTFSVMFPMNNRVQNMTKGSSAILIVCTVSLFWVVFYSWYNIYMEFVWFPDYVSFICTPSMVPNVTILVFPMAQFDVKYTEKYKYLLRFIPSVVYPVLTTFLFLELRKIKKKRLEMNKNSDGGEKSNSTTKLILFMTVSFMFSEGLAGVMQLIGNYVNPKKSDDVEAMELMYKVSVVTDAVMVLRTWNALSHFFVCYMMSSQYRDTVKRMFCCCKPKFNIIMVKGSEPNSDSNTKILKLSKPKSY
ncbi:hypothetical protein CAEBREN_21620 [Caenorhabditis brenneri]|uniref:G-protein coupled receptors family 1 profile domain-containing protein n=1 Tax=Caenorhabditis brenneri TaxID=135651 RepID=G0P472_CAEBE|nr:hypothetical protein CAEBREN_21620 [Caenorhabditis brenneri]